MCDDNGVSRFLFVPVPVVARLWPAVAIGDALAASGHEVAWCGPESNLGPLLPPGATIYPTGKRSYREFRQSGTAAVRELWDEYVVPLNRFIQGPVDRAVAEYRPDVVVADQFFRPAEVDLLIGDPSKARATLRWKPTVGFEELIRMMVDADLEAVRASTSSDQ